MDWKNQTIVYPTDKNLNVLDDFKNGKNVCLWGTSVLVKRDLVEQIGYLDEKLFSYWEDTDYSLRSLHFGYKNLLCISTKILHKTQLPMNGPTGRKPYFFYYMARNNYFIGIKYFKKLMGLHFIGNYLSYIVISVMNRINNNSYEDADAVLDGAWSAFKGIGGVWNKDINMPKRFKKIFYFLSTWHPYFWATLLRCDIVSLASEGLRRFKKNRIYA